jgi:hypothetical protein
MLQGFAHTPVCRDLMTFIYKTKGGPSLCHLPMHPPLSGFAESAPFNNISEHACAQENEIHTHDY